MTRTALLLLISASLPWPCTWAAENVHQPSPLELSGIVELQLSHNNGLTSWLDRGQGKHLHGGNNNNRIQNGLSGLELDYRLSHSAHLKASVLYNQKPGNRLDVTELYWQYRPLRQSRWRPSYKVGFFYPNISLENRGRLWSSPYTITSSTINSWIGEELRTAGAEVHWRNLGRQRQSFHDFGVTTALFGFNDNTGSLLSWRGWTNSERQTGIGGRLPLANRPTFAPGRVLADQTPEVEPFIERDNRIGYYSGLHWNYRQSTKAALHYYDNNADPSAFERGQYAWHTRFLHLGAQHRIDSNWELLAQYMRGRTQMDNSAGNVVYNHFDSGYLMLAGRWGPQRLALRWESFHVDDLDGTFMDSNGENGSSATISYSYRVGEHWKFTGEAINIRSDRRERRYSGLSQQADETRLLFSTRYFWAS
ncbi:hypothetical protein QSV34_02415 [Porticoccus sp. W117]|uniref:hypothetical protein n=1 Tax=Porticoccus sp. W117 TaxID=3054777 RepID=UPI0025998448|nr:hypothetical protein [Porticoccus sp. W117]MDM3870204.1 hypothetical protein [Porticoccus sp. W117]